MNTLILYATHHGAARKIAKLIAQELPEAIVKDIEDGEPHLAAYDCVILGSSVEAGQIRRPLKRFISRHQDELLDKRLGLFLSGLSETGENKYFRDNFPPQLLEAAVVKQMLGGVYNPQVCSLAERIIMRLVAGCKSYVSTVNHQRIAAFADALKEK